MQEKLLELERELAGVMSLQDMAGTVLDKVQRLMGASGSTLFSFDQHGAISTHGGSLESARSNYTPGLFREDALQQWAVRVPASTFISDGTQRLDYRPLDIAFVMGIWPSGLSYGSAQMFGLLLTKPHPFRPSGTEAITGLRQLEIPFRTAARRIAQFSALEQTADVLSQLPERQLGSLALWDVEGRLVWLSATVQRLLESKLRRSDLERAAHIALHQLHARSATSEALLGRPRLLRSAGGPLMRVAFSWIAGPDRRPWLLAEIEEFSRAESLLSQLTGAETRVLRLLVQGLSNAELSARLQVSHETVKTHLKRIFVKLGVSSRVRAVHVASEGWSAHLRRRRERA